MVTTPRQPQLPTSRVLNYTKRLGPTLIAVGLSIGPGAVITASSTGSALGFNVLWLILLSSIYGYVYFDMAIRVGLFSPDTAMQALARKFGRPTAAAVGILYYIMTILVMSGSILGCGIGLHILLGGPLRLWFTLTAAIAFVAVGTTRGYKIIERVIMVLVGLLLITFGITALVVGPPWTSVASGLAPSWISTDHVLPLISLLATALTPYAAIYMTYSIREKRTPQSKYRETTLGDTLPSVIAFTIVLVAIFLLGAMLGQGHAISDGPDLVRFLRPSVGGLAVVIIGVGMFAAGFSSVLGDFAAVGAVTTDSLGQGKYLGNRFVRVIGGSNVLVSLIILLLVNGQPELLVIIANAANIFLIPILSVAILILAHDKSRLGHHTNNIVHDVIAAVGLVVYILSAIKLAVSTFS